MIKNPKLKTAAKLLQPRSQKTYLLKVADTAIIKVRSSHICIAPHFTLNSPSDMRDSQTSFITIWDFSCNPRSLTDRASYQGSLSGFSLFRIASMKQLLIMRFQDIIRSNVLKEKTEVIMAIAYLQGQIATLIITVHHQISTIMGAGLVSG